MNSGLFAKPSPVAPLPLDIWLDDADRAEVGREPFFRGRDEEYKIFQRAVSTLNAGRIGGGTMIFQGAPGAGKTALRQECMESIRVHSTADDPWVAVNIKPGNLKSSIEVVMLIVDAVNTESERLSQTISRTSADKLKNLLGLGRKLYQELSERGVGIAGFSFEGKPESEQDTSELSQRVFQNASKLLENFHVVIFVDEAQNTPVLPATKDVVDCLHAPPANIPLITAFFGLGDTEGVLTDCGLSRLADERVANLGVLSQEEASDVIRAVFQAYRFTGSLKDQDMWVEHLAELSQGWPQHINRVAVAAARVIRDQGGEVNVELIQKALEEGKRRKENYYATRLAACSQEPDLYKQIAIAANEVQDGVLSRSKLQSIVKPLLDEPRLTFDDFLKNALHAGVLSETRKIPKHYQIPIPSFSDYLQTLPL